MRSIDVRSILIKGTSYAMIFVFMYAAVIKGIDAITFKNQMLQSPLLPSYLIPYLVFAVPAIEILASILIIIPKAKATGLLLGYSIMLSFSIYMVSLIVFFQGNVPCACGGILGKMGYTAHIIFNISLTLLCLISYLLTTNNAAEKSK